MNYAFYGFFFTLFFYSGEMREKNLIKIKKHSNTNTLFKYLIIFSVFPAGRITRSLGGSGVGVLWNADGTVRRGFGSPGGSKTAGMVREESAEYVRDKSGA